MSSTKSGAELHWKRAEEKGRWKKKLFLLGRPPPSAEGGREGEDSRACLIAKSLERRRRPGGCCSATLLLLLAQFIAHHKRRWRSLLSTFQKTIRSNKTFLLCLFGQANIKGPVDCDPFLPPHQVPFSSFFLFLLLPPCTAPTSSAAIVHCRWPVTCYSSNFFPFSSSSTVSLACRMCPRSWLERELAMWVSWEWAEDRSLLIGFPLQKAGVQARLSQKGVNYIARLANVFVKTYFLNQNSVQFSERRAHRASAGPQS
jgi:hypothetical protein